MEDKELITKIQLLKKIKPTEEWVLSLRARLAFRLEMERKKNLLDRDLFALREVFSFWGSQQPKFAFRALYGLILAFGVVLGGGVLAVAAINSSPSSPLYPVKIAIEKVRLVASFSDEDKINLQTEMAGYRLDELSEIVASQDTSEQKEKKVGAVVDNLQQQLDVTKNDLPKIASQTGVSQKAVDTAKAVSEKAGQVEKAIVQARENLPGEVQQNLSQKLTEVAEAADKTNMQALEVILSSHNQSDNSIATAEIAARLEREIDKIKEQISGEEQKLALMPPIADKLPIKLPIRAVLISQAEQAQELLIQAQKLAQQAQERVDSGDFFGSFEIIKAVKEVIKGTEKLIDSAISQGDSADLNVRENLIDGTNATSSTDTE